MTSTPTSSPHETSAPLAERLRPQALGEFVGQSELVGPDGVIRRALASGKIPSMILWGPPGAGKTTLAQILGREIDATWHYISAVLSGIAELRELVQRIASERDTLFATRHILFVDEIHRWNKAQQDALLPYVEHGTITLIGATTENPSFEIIGALLSRCQVFVLNALNENDLQQIAARALCTLDCTMTDDALAWAVRAADGDARHLLNLLELACAQRADPTRALTIEDLAKSAQSKRVRYDKAGEEHYNLISAFIKSMRASDPDAAIYYLARMYEAGEDPRFLARRMVIFASEDIGNAHPGALPFAVAAFQAYECVGQAEGWIPLAQAATYLACAPKSNASYAAYKSAKTDVENCGTLPTPLHLRNAPTALMKNLGYGADYHYPHTDPSAAAAQTYLPDQLRGKIYYQRPKR